MARGSCTFKQQAVTRALRGAVAAGIEVQRIEIDPVSGKIVMIFVDVPVTAAEAAEATALNAWRASRGAR